MPVSARIRGEKTAERRRKKKDTKQSIELLHRSVKSAHQTCWMKREVKGLTEERLPLLVPLLLLLLDHKCEHIKWIITMQVTFDQMHIQSKFVLRVTRFDFLCLVNNEFQRPRDSKWLSLSLSLCLLWSSFLIFTHLLVDLAYANHRMYKLNTWFRRNSEAQGEGGIDQFNSHGDKWWQIKSRTQHRHNNEERGNIRDTERDRERSNIRGRERSIATTQAKWINWLIWWRMSLRSKW